MVWRNVEGRIKGKILGIPSLRFDLSRRVTVSRVMSEQENGSREEPCNLMASGLGGSGPSTEIKEPLLTHSAYNSWSYLYFGFDFGGLKTRVWTRLEHGIVTQLYKTRFCIYVHVHICCFCEGEKNDGEIVLLPTTPRLFSFLFAPTVA